MLGTNSVAVVETSPLVTGTTSSSSSSVASSSLDALTDSDYAKVGLAMWLNNAPDRAEQHFRAKLQSTPIFAGYAFTVSMVGDLWVATSKLFVHVHIINQAGCDLN